MTADLTDLAIGIAEILAAGEVGTWDPTGNPVADPNTAIVLGKIPAKPSKAIALTPYSVTDDPKLTSSIGGVQLRFRGTTDMRSVIAMSAAAFGLLQGAEPGLMGGLNVSLIWRQNSGSMGMDETERWEWQDSYYCRLDWPTLHRDF